MPEPASTFTVPGDPAERLDPTDGAASPMEHAFAGGRLQRLDPRWIAASRIADGIGWSVIGAAALAGVIIITVIASRLVGLILLGAWIGLGGLVVWSILVYPRWFYARARYRVSGDGIQIRRGVWWRRVIDVPLSRIQHTDVNQGPLLRRFGLATLVVHTAGTAHASVELEGLPRETALAIRDFLIRGGGDDAV